MGRIKISDLQKDSKITKEEMRRIRGGSIILSGDIISLESLWYSSESNDRYIGLVKPVPAINWIEGIYS